MKTLGLDIGSTYIKAGWLDGGRAREVQRLPMPAFVDTSGTARELDPAVVLETVYEILDYYSDAESIWIAGQMSCFTFVDRDGNALVPIISWQDERVNDVQPLAYRLGPDLVRALGNELRPGLPIATLGLVSVIPTDIRQSGYFTSLMGFVAGSLIGTWAHATHVSDAAASGMWDLVAGAWNSDAVAEAGLRVDQMPAGTWSCVPLGRTARGALVHAPVGDQQASLIGAGLRLGALSVNIATGGQASVLTTTCRHAPGVQLRPYVNGDYLRTVTHLPAGRALTTVIRLLNHGEVSESAWKWAADAYIPDQADLNVNLPRWDMSFFSPDGGSLCVLTGETTADECMTAAINHVAEGFVAAAHRLGPSESLIFSGGLAKKLKPLRHAIAGALNLPTEVHEGDDAALDGLAQLARRGFG